MKPKARNVAQPQGKNAIKDSQVWSFSIFLSHLSPLHMCSILPYFSAFLGFLGHMAYFYDSREPGPTTWGSKSKFLERDFLVQVLIPRLSCSHVEEGGSVEENFWKRCQGGGYLTSNLMTSVLQKGKDELNMPPKPLIWRYDGTPPVNRQDKETGRITRDRGVILSNPRPRCRRVLTLLVYSKISKVVGWITRFWGPHLLLYSQWSSERMEKRILARTK